MSYNNPNESATIKMENRTLKQKIDLLEEEKKHAIDQQKKWQSNYFTLKDEHEKLSKAYKTLYDATIANTRRKEQQEFANNVESQR
jgi:hypothetical protein